jgi:L-methionine (R)-S-oxide reductase
MLMSSSEYRNCSELLSWAKVRLAHVGQSSPDIASALKEIFAEYMNLDQKTSFMGVYLNRRDVLGLGPYVGPPTVHDVIPVSRGAVGRCAESIEPIVIPDVSQCEYYLSCCEDVRSEILVPITGEQGNLGVLDLDSHRVNAYKKRDIDALVRLAKLITPACVLLADRLQIRVSYD